MHQILAHRVQPAGGPTLGEEVVLAIVVDQPVKVVDPPFLMLHRVEVVVGPLPGREVELGPQGLVVARF